MDEITKPILKKLVAKLVEKGLAKDSIRLILAALKILYVQAIDDKIVSENPVKGLSTFYRQAPVRHEEIGPSTRAER